MICFPCQVIRIILKHSCSYRLHTFLVEEKDGGILFLNSSSSCSSLISIEKYLPEGYNKLKKLIPQSEVKEQFLADMVKKE